MIWWLVPEPGAELVAFNVRRTSLSLLPPEPARSYPVAHGASPKQLCSLRALKDGTLLVVAELDLHISVDGLVTRIMEESPQAIRRSGARLAGLATSAAKATASARNGRLGGRPKTKAQQHG